MTGSQPHAPDDLTGTVTAAATLDRSKRAAIVFVPGISRSWGEGSLRKMADDVVAALGQVQVGATFKASPAEQLQVEVGSEPRPVRHVVINRMPAGGSEAEATLDLYELEYVRELAARQESQSLVVRAARVAFTLILGFKQLFAFVPFVRKGKSRKERFQLGLMLLVLALYAAFLGILLAGIIALFTETLDLARLAAQAGGSAPSPTASPTPSSASSASAAIVNAASTGPLDWLRSAATSLAGRLAQLAAVVAAFFWLVMPPKAKIREAITNTATDYLGAQWYLSEAAGAPRISGGFVSLIAKLVDDGKHGRIDVVSYSLGSIVAINQLFPADVQLPEGHALRSVSTLVTVGCPYDAIRLLLPNYLKGRKPAPNVPAKWLNVYAPNDILGSNFRDDSEEGKPQASVVMLMSSEPAETSVMPEPNNVPYLPGGVPAGGGPFGGLRIHGSYWGEKPGDETCWTRIVPEMFRVHPLLAASTPTQPAEPEQP